jgi:hypothetical protein
MVRFFDMAFEGGVPLIQPPDRFCHSLFFDDRVVFAMLLARIKCHYDSSSIPDSEFELLLGSHSCVPVAAFYWSSRE